jgi:DNA-binding GntR family transcriptional regulator
MSNDIKSDSLRDQAYQRIRGKMVLGGLASGSQISEPKLVEMLGIGRTPVREAIQQLEVEGLVERIPRKGTVVRVPNRDDFVDLYELREGLESFAVRLATQRISATELARLHAVCTQLKRIADETAARGDSVLSANSMRRFLAADMSFHLLLINATGNQHIMKLVSDSHVMSRIFSTARQEHTLDIVQAAYQIHSDIFEAVASADANKAAALMVRHIRQSLCESLEHFFQQAEQILPESDLLMDLPLPEELLREINRIDSPEKGFEEGISESRLESE